jgi:Ser/Thr protein kinase RdoA (MazF antagonist)
MSDAIPPPPPDVERPAAFALRDLPDDAVLRTVATVKLEGGFVGYGVFRHDLEFRLAGTAPRVASFVQKLTISSEVQTMRALAHVPDASAVPALVDFDLDYSRNDITWFVAPFYEGTLMQWGEETPSTVIRSLARVHAHFLPQADDVKWIYRVDASFFTRTFDNAMAALQKAAESIPSTRESADRLADFKGMPIQLAALERLPVTLVHGDVHPGNIVRLAGGEAVLIDWGNARIAPAMLDLANVVPLGSPGWHAYLAAYESASGQPVDLELATLGYHWATAMVMLQYMPWAAFHGPKTADMVETVFLAAEDCERTIN